jgi:tRNA (guanine-N7-)-methyltransferase
MVTPGSELENGPRSLPRRLVYGRHVGRGLTQYQEELLKTALPELQLDLSQPAPRPLERLFGEGARDVWLEIGFGGGEHLLHEARSSPATGFIGIEPFQNGLAKAAAIVEREAIRNVRLFDRDATILLDWLPAESLDRIDLLYPDPWPKMRHWKRRFVNPQNLERIARCLKPRGLFRFASDVDAYVKWTLREVGRSDRLIWTADCLEDCRQPWPGWPGTRYEAKAVAEQRRTAYLVFRRSA